MTSPPSFERVDRSPSGPAGRTARRFARDLLLFLVFLLFLLALARNASAQSVTVTSVSPGLGGTSGGSNVTITGTGFGAGASVTFGGTAATNVVVVSATSITARTPARAAGAVTVAVSNPGGSSGQLPGGFTYVASSGSTLKSAAGSGCSGSTVVVPVEISGSEAPLAVQFDVTFDPASLSVSSVAVGSLTSGFQLSSNNQSGRLRVAMASGSPASSGSGEVMKITFQGASGLTGGTSTPVAIENAVVNDLAADGVGSSISCPAATALAITSISPGSPGAGSTFSVTVESRSSAGVPTAVSSATGVQLSVRTGTGQLGGAVSGTIAAGASSVTISGVTYSKGEAGVVLTATRTSGDTLAAGDSAAFTVTSIPFGIPPNFNAAALSASQISISWTGVANAGSYELQRSSGGGFGTIASTTATSVVDSGLGANTTYVYRVRAVGTGGSTAFSSPEIATTVLFNDDPLVATATTIQAVHLTQLRTAVNAVRAAAGLPAQAFTDSSLSGVAVRAVHVLELRTALDAARAAIGLPALSHPSGVGVGETVNAAPFTTLRSGVK